MTEPSVRKQILQDIQNDLKSTRNWAYVLILSGLLLQVIHLILDLLPGFSLMLILTGVILVVSGILFLIGASTVPRSTDDVIKRLQQIMLHRDPKRRLWAAQRLVGFLKDVDLPKEDFLSLTRYIQSVVRDPPVSPQYKPYISVDHIVVLRELAVQVPMTKHARKQFVDIIRPIRKLDGLPEDAINMLNDAIAYNPKKLPIQAYDDLMKEL